MSQASGKVVSVLKRLRGRQEWHFFAVLPKADPVLATVWWVLLMLNGAMPAIFAVAIGVTVGAVQQARPVGGPLALTGLVFVLMLILNPIQTAVSMNLGNKVSAWLNEALIRACVQPPGIGHLEDPDLAEDLTTAREFDRGMTGPPMYLNVDFLATNLVSAVGGVASAVVLVGFAWWAALILVAAWGSTHWLLRESGVWRDRNTPEVRSAQRHADYAYRLAVDPQPAKELRLFGIAGWTVERFIARRKRLFELQYRATRLREKSVIWCMIIVIAANAAVFAALGLGALSEGIPLDRLVVYAQVAFGVSLIAFGGLNWVLDGAAAPVAAVARLGPAMAPLGALTVGHEPATGMPSREISFHDVSFSYPGSKRAVLSGLELTVPAGTSLAIVGQNGAGKTTLAKLLCRLYDPTNGAITVDGVDLRSLERAGWRRRLAAVFQDFVRFELSLRENVDPAAEASDSDIRAALVDAGAETLAELDTPLAKGYPNGIDLSGGQWQRIALARALCAVRRGAGLVLLDEPTAQLDVRGEAEVFERVLQATRDVTTILISHRFSTVRHADRICVLEHGRVVELGSHDELMALGGRYKTMFQLQAKRFEASMDEEGVVFDVLS
ncbi:MAG TPA: ABC transporter ATP-binding protein [Propionibacteriaceae bacterium]|jgi:ABC-type multidrug transport system fused ATPase/permease subunit|nr:ABC transporter ATP-binding protein [Propionibacteriaceae bacterium]